MSRLYIDKNNKLHNRLSDEDYEKLLLYSQQSHITEDNIHVKTDMFSMGIDLVKRNTMTFMWAFDDESSELNLHYPNKKYLYQVIPEIWVERVDRVLEEIQRFLSLDLEMIVIWRLFILTS